MPKYNRKELKTALTHFFQNAKLCPDLFNFCIDIFEVLTNEKTWKKHLNELNKQIAASSKAELPNLNPIEVTTVGKINVTNYSKEYCHADTCAEALEKILLQQEQKFGFNLGLTTDTIPTFRGEVPSEVGNQIITSGFLWYEAVLDPTTFLHGALSHRIQFYILTKAIEAKEISPKVDIKNCLIKLINSNFKLTFLHSTSIRTLTLWNICLDCNLIDLGFGANFPTLFDNVDRLLLLISPISVHHQCVNRPGFQNRPHLAAAVSTIQYRAVVTAAEILQVFPLQLTEILINSLEKKPIDEGLAVKFIQYIKQWGNETPSTYCIVNNPLKAKAKLGSIEESASQSSTTETDNDDVLQTIAPK